MVEFVNHRLSELERRFTVLGGKVDHINDLCIRIDAKMGEIPSKSDVLWFGGGLVFLLFIVTLIGHVLIRYFGTP